MKRRAADAQIDSLKAARMIPRISRGTKTQFIFDRYNIETDHCAIIVRGHGKEIIRQISSRN